MAALSLAGCSDDENGNGGNGGNGGSGEGGNPSGGDLTEILFEDGTQIGDGRQEFEIKGDYTLPKGTYLLKGWCYIADGASLTLAPGTIIKGDKETKAALIVEPGGQLWAKGTQIDHVQVSYSNDDSYEWFGGAVNAKYLISYHTWDDDFDTDNGFCGKVQFCLGVRHPRIADTSASNGFESDNNGEGSATSPFTSCVFSNVTFVGPVGQDAAFSNTSDYITAGDMNPKNGSKLGQFQSAMQVRRNSHLNCFNSVAMGFPVGLIVENDKGSQTQTAASEGTLKIQNVYMAGMTVLGSDVNKSFEDGFCDNGDKNSIDKSKESFSSTYFKSIASNKYFDAIADLKLSQPNSLQANPNYGPLSDSPLRGAASFTDPLVANGFDEVTYIGAFADENDGWMSGWTEFDPQNKAY